MAATRYLVEGERLDVLISQVKRMGRRVTVLKAEKVRKGGIAGFGGKEHYEILVEVEGVGETPESFNNATSRAGVKKAGKERKTLSEISDDAGIYRRKKSPEEVLAQRKESVAQNLAQDKENRSEALDKDSSESRHDGVLQSLLDEARSQLNSNTEAAAAELESQLEQLGLGKSEPSLPSRSESAKPQTPGEATKPDTPSAAKPPASPILPAPSGLIPRPAGGMIDARLQGVAAPGASAAVARAQTEVFIPHGATASIQAVNEWGFPLELTAELADMNNEVSLDALVDNLPLSVAPLTKPGAMIVVVGASPIALSVVETAQRLAGRIGEDAFCVLGGPKTTLPGEALRARSGEELRELVQAHPGQSCVLAVADSLIEAHRRTMAKLLSVIYVDQTWAVVDGRQPVEKIQAWLRALPDTLHPDALAIQRVWEAKSPGSLFELEVPIGMLDGVPARGEAWKMLLEDLMG